MSEKPYTPSTDEVRAGWITGETRDGLGVDHDDLQPGVAAEFDRWLNEVKAQVWDEGYGSCNEYQNGYVPAPRPNPYRKGN